MNQSEAITYNKFCDYWKDNDNKWKTYTDVYKKELYGYYLSLRKSIEYQFSI